MHLQPIGICFEQHAAIGCAHFKFIQRTQRQARHPVWVETRLVTGYFDALPLRELCKEREDLSYIPKVVRNADRGDIPGYTFNQNGEETLNDYFKALEKELAAAAPVGAAAAAAVTE